MQYSVGIKIYLQIRLTAEEADWLHNVMQNTLHGQNPVDESPTDSGMRRKFFDATKVAE